MAAVAALGLPAAWDVDIATARANYRRSRGLLRPAAEPVDHVEDLAIPGPGGPIPARRYRGKNTAKLAPLPAVVWFHGGGWTFGDLDTHDCVCRELADDVRGEVFAIDYRLAPEHRFPAAFDDALAATQWIAANAQALGLHPERIAVAGDSAGGNLAAAVAIHARDAGGPRIAMQALVYPALDFSFASASYARLGTGYMLTRQSMEWYRSIYLRDAADRSDWRASPLACPDLTGLPEAYMITAGFDPLRDEGLAYAERLHAAGVRMTHECFQGMIHGFITMGGRVAAASHAIYRIAQHLRIGFGLQKLPPVRVVDTKD